MKIREWSLVWGRVAQQEPGFGVGDGRQERKSFPSKSSCAFQNSVLGSQSQNSLGHVGTCSIRSPTSELGVFALHTLSWAFLAN